MGRVFSVLFICLFIYLFIIIIIIFFYYYVVVFFVVFLKLTPSYINYTINETFALVNKTGSKMNFRNKVTIRDD